MELEIAGKQYRVAKINAVEQFHIARQLAPVLGEIAPHAGAGEKGALDALPAIAKALAAMPRESADSVLFGLLAAVQRKEPQGLGWSAVVSGQAMMYQDIGLPEMMQLAWAALRENLGDFFAAIPSALPGGNPNHSAP